MRYFELFCDNTLKTGQSVWLTATGTSMWPLITAGMKAEIKPLKSRLPQKGDLLLIRKEQGLVIHRCWEVREQEGFIEVLTKGDANLAFDQPVPLEMILGKASLLKHVIRGSWNLNNHFWQVYGRLLCSSTFLAKFWARLCRFGLNLWFFFTGKPL